MTTPAMNRRFDAVGSIRQPIHAGGGAGVALETPCARPVQISTRTAERFKLATVTNTYESFVPYNNVIRPGAIMAIGGRLFTIQQVGEYNAGRGSIMQLVLEAQA